MKDFNSLRREFPVFEYASFSIEDHGKDLLFRFRFLMPPSLSFSPEVLFESPPPSWKDVPREALQNLAFHLGLIELFSYWKATCSPTIRIHAGPISEEQIDWWKDLLLHGMGEFFYRNDIDFTAENFVKIEASVTPARQSACYTGPLSDRSLVMIGGGRDSAYTAAVLKRSGEPFNCMMLNPGIAAAAIARDVVERTR